MLLALLLAFTFFVLVSWGWKSARATPHLWIWSWGFLIVAGLLLALEPTFLRLELARLLTGVFPGLQLAGAYLYAQQRVPAWVFIATIIIALVRSMVAVMGYHDISHLVVLPAELAVLAIAARIVLDRQPGGRDAIDWALCFAMVALCGVQTMDALYDLGRVDGSVLWAPWLVYGGIAGTLQIGIVSERIRRIRTERTLAHGARQQAIQRLESLGTLAGGVAHDFNNRLQGILGNIELAKLHLPEGHPSREALERGLSDGKRAAQLVEQIRTFASIQPYNAQTVDLGSWLQTRGDFLRNAAGLRFHVDVRAPASVPLVDADLIQLEQCLVNLLQNAAEAYSDKTGDIRLKLEVLEFQSHPPDCVIGELSCGRHLRITVEDDGEGICVHPPARIFEPFFSTRFVGRGMGLAVTQQIVRAHNGAIDLRSDTTGTAISLYFPVPARTHTAMQ